MFNRTLTLNQIALFDYGFLTSCCFIGSLGSIFVDATNLFADVKTYKLKGWLATFYILISQKKRLKEFVNNIINIILTRKFYIVTRCVHFMLFSGIS